MDFGFSILICNRNYGRFVAEAIDSCLAQNYPQELFEVVVVDDGSEDNSQDILKNYSHDQRVKIVQQQNQGQASAFQTALMNASKDFICLLDSDDYFLPDKLKTLAEKLADWQVDKNTKFFLSHDFKILDQESKEFLNKSWFRMTEIDAGYESLPISSIYKLSPFSNPCGQVYSKVLLQEILAGLPLNDWKQGVDSTLAHAALFITGRVYYLHECLAVYRIHESNFSITYNKSNKLVTSKLKLVSLRWPKLIYYLENLLNTLELGEVERNERLRFLRQKERDFKINSQKYSAPFPKVAIVILNYNYGRYLKQAVESALNQTYSNLQIVLCDDASTDDSQEIILDYQRKNSGCIQTVFNQVNKGALALLKAAYASIKNVDYFVVLDADDTLDNSFVERHIYTHRFSSLCMVTSSDIRMINSQGEMLHANCYNSAGSWTKALEYFPPFSASLQSWIFAPSSANMFRKTKMTDLFFEALNDYFCSEFRIMQDWLLLFYAHIVGGSTRLNECLTSMRIHGENNCTQLHFPTPCVKALAQHKPNLQAAAFFFLKLFTENIDALQKHYSADGLKAYFNWIKSTPGINLNQLVQDACQLNIKDELKILIKKGLIGI